MVKLNETVLHDCLALFQGYDVEILRPKTHSCRGSSCYLAFVLVSIIVFQCFSFPPWNFRRFFVPIVLWGCIVFNLTKGCLKGKPNPTERRFSGASQVSWCKRGWCGSWSMWILVPGSVPGRSDLMDIVYIYTLVNQHSSGEWTHWRYPISC